MGKILGLKKAGVKPTHSHLWCDPLLLELPSPWEQDGGQEGYASSRFLRRTRMQ